MKVVERIIEIFKIIAQPHDRRYIQLGDSEKVQAITSFLSTLGMKHIVSERHGILVGNPFRAETIIMSHMDTISKFNNIFRGEKKLKEKDYLVVGPLDNTITNAILLYLIEKDPGMFKNTMVVFTIGEEPSFECGFYEQCGAHNLFEDFKSHITHDTRVINLDVTANGYHGMYDSSHGSISVAKEFVADDHTSFLEYMQISSKFMEATLRLAGRDVQLVHYDHGTCDDLMSVPDYFRDKFSFCLPIENCYHSVIHSPNTFTTKRKLSGYTNHLELLIRKGEKDEV